MDKQHIHCSVEDCKYNSDGAMCNLGSIKIAYSHDSTSPEQQSLCADFCREGQVGSEVDMEGKGYR